LLPLPDFKMGLTYLEGGPERPVVLVCRTDKRSSDAARLMDAAGWRQVSVLSGGMEAWHRAGLPVER
jgi:rhodanese-related sulfurtransferase